jgi:hypothetical protein
MTSQVLFEQLVALHAEHGDTHRRMLAALEANDLFGLVDASRRQGELCTEQSALLADYVAAVVTATPDLLAPADRERVSELARTLRDERRGARTQKAG